MTHKVLIEKKALSLLNQVTDKTNQIIREKIKILRDNPYPGEDGDKELLHLPGDYQLFRLHIARSYTVFYKIEETENQVRVLDIMTTEKSHKKYGRF